MTRATESSATNGSKTSDKNWEISENQSLMEIEDQEEQDQENQLVDAQNVVVQLDWLCIMI